MIDTTSVEWRATCEARHWLRLGYTSSDRVDALLQRIADRRGQEAANALLEEMRNQWRSRQQWLGTEPQ